MSSELLPCPGGCGEMLHRSASECSRCGFRSRLAQVEDILGSLSTLSSILTGFGLSAIVQLATVAREERADLAVLGPMACWIVSSLLLLGVLVGAELLRRRERETRISPQRADEDALWDRAQWLLSTFALSLLPIAAGVVWLGAFFSVWLAVIGGLALLAALFILVRSL